MRRMRRLFVRIRPDKNEVNILRGFLTAIERSREKGLMLPDMLYLDYAASTPVDARVAELMFECRTQAFANPSSNHAGRPAEPGAD